MNTRRPDIDKAKANEDKSKQLLNRGDAFSAMATRIAQQAAEQKAETAPQSDAGLVSTPMTSPTNNSSPPPKKPSKKKKPRDEKSEQISNNGLVIPYQEAGQINKLIESYVDYLNQQRLKNPKQQVAIQNKIDLANALTLNKAEKLDFEKFTDAYGFTSTARMIKKHRDESFLNKYRQSQGARLIDSIENLLPESYAKELKVRRLRYSLEKYQAHLNDAFFTSQALNEKKQVVASMLKILTPKSDTNLDEMLGLFAAGWNASLSVVVKHRNTFFEVAQAQSEGEKLKLNIENILKTGKDLPESSYSVHM
jgi:hypothetical protein